jgi:ribosomal protein L37AE/L43A
MKVAKCPSCGAQLKFRAFQSKVCICDFCKSTVVRDGSKLEDIGKMADIQDDPTPIQIGTDGSWDKANFTVLGRLRYEYEDGLWNEWYVQFGNGDRVGWLTEAQGEYTLTWAVKGTLPALPAFTELTPGQNLNLGGKSFEVADIQSARVVAGEGELPFKVGMGYEAPVADLRNSEGGFATLDYSDGAPVLYTGNTKPFDDFNFRNLRNVFADTGTPVKGKEFKCLGCGAPLTFRSRDIKTVACGHCGTVIDTAKPTFQIVAKVEELHRNPKLVLPLGGKAHFRGHDYEMIGVMRRTVGEGVDAYTWTEYLLYHDKQGYRWLSEYNGHFSFITPATKRPQAPTKGDATYLGKRYQHFAHYICRTTYVAGEFYWRVELGDEAIVDDYIAPPGLISRERSGKELSWSHSEYVTGDDVWKAMKLPGKPPAALGVAPNQPSPHTGSIKRHWFWFVMFLLAAIVVHMVMAVVGGKRLMIQDLQFVNKTPWTSQPFTLTRDRNVNVNITIGQSNAWADLDITLVDQKQGVVGFAEQALSYYTGVDGGESWQEGARTVEVGFGRLAKGTYYLRLAGDTPPNVPAIPLTVQAEESGVAFSNFVLAILFLLIFPLIEWWRLRSFETRRWQESDLDSDDE